MVAVAYCVCVFPCFPSSNGLADEDSDFEDEEIASEAPIEAKSVLFFVRFFELGARGGLALVVLLVASVAPPHSFTPFHYLSLLGRQVRVRDLSWLKVHLRCILVNPMTY